MYRFFAPRKINLNQFFSTKTFNETTKKFTLGAVNIATQAYIITKATSYFTEQDNTTEESLPNRVLKSKF